MPTLIFSSEMPCSVERLWEFHSSPEALIRLMPPGQRVTVEGDARVETGAIHRLTIVRFGIPMRWVARIEIAEPPSGTRSGLFVDVAERSPFAVWRHEHRMESTSTGSRLIDTIELLPPLGSLGLLAYRIFLRWEIERLFAHRHEATRAAVR